MPRRESLTPSERSQLLAFPTDESELLRRYTLTRSDLAYISEHRGPQNRLGIAIQLYPWIQRGQHKSARCSNEHRTRQVAAVRQGGNHRLCASTRTSTREDRQVMEPAGCYAMDRNANRLIMWLRGLDSRQE